MQSKEAFWSVGPSPLLETSVPAGQVGPSNAQVSCFRGPNPSKLTMMGLPHKLARTPQNHDL